MLCARTTSSPASTAVQVPDGANRTSSTHLRAALIHAAATHSVHRQRSAARSGPKTWLGVIRGVPPPTAERDPLAYIVLCVPETMSRPSGAARSDRARPATRAIIRFRPACGGWGRDECDDKAIHRRHDTPRRDHVVEPRMHLRRRSLARRASIRVRLHQRGDAGIRRTRSTARLAAPPADRRVRSRREIAADHATKIMSPGRTVSMGATGDQFLRLVSMLPQLAIGINMLRETNTDFSRMTRPTASWRRWGRHAGQDMHEHDAGRAVLRGQHAGELASRQVRAARHAPAARLRSSQRAR
jgi:hypothetical protein